MSLKKFKEKFRKKLRKAVKAPKPKSKYGEGKKLALVAYTTSSGQKAFRHQMVGTSKEYPIQYKIPQEVAKLWDINYKNPLLSTQKYSGESVKKFAINPKTNEFIISSNEAHAKTIFRAGADQFDSYIRGIYNAEQNVAGLRVPVNDADWKKQYEVYEQLKKDNMPNFQVAADVQNENLDETESFDLERYKASKGRKAVLFGDNTDPRFHKFEYNLAITPKLDKEQFTTPGKVLNAFKLPKYIAFEKECNEVAKQFGVMIINTAYVLGKWGDLEPSFSFTLEGDKRDIQRFVDVGKRHQQHCVIFAREGRGDIGARVDLDYTNVEMKTLTKMLSDARFNNYSVIFQEHNGKAQTKCQVLLYRDSESSETPEAFRGRTNAFLNSALEAGVLVDQKFENLETTMVNLDNKQEYEAYSTGAKFIKAMENKKTERYTVTFFGGGAEEAQKARADIEKNIWLTVAREANE